MSELSTQETDDDRSGEGPPKGCGDCRPHLIDCLTCRAKAIEKQAAYNATVQPELLAARADYDTARTAYRAKRREVELTVQDMRHESKRLIDRIRCLIKQDSVIRCLDRAWCQVAEELDACSGPPGCCADALDSDYDTGDVSWECDPDADEGEVMSDADYEALRARITAYENRAERARQCFLALVKEPEELGKRVVAVRAELDAINAALAADSPATDLRHLYAQALVARRHLRLIWNGFPETRDYSDCLCRALTCWTTGVAAISVLVGKQAFEECRRDARAARCEKLRTETAEAILAAYDKLCPQKDCDGDEVPVDPDCAKHPDPCGDKDDEDDRDDGDDRDDRDDDRPKQRRAD
ncbi:hypothetical protein R8Z50_12950 [Longispora sp. K20-0274]|uniref:hypothetical protein n=1 Tax=Longispora sp. K20-0274 TaxID=3088255 RepID=UPI00399A2873